MRFTAEINIMPQKALLDPQGKAVRLSMHNIGYQTIENVRIGKHITMELDADSQEHAEQKVKETCEKILSNPIMEEYNFTISKN